MPIDPLGAPVLPVLPPAPPTIQGPPHTPDQVREVAQKFEALLLTNMLKGLRRTVPESREPNSQRELYYELFDETLAADLSKKGGIGVADMIQRYLERGPEIRR